MSVVFPHVGLQVLSSLLYYLGLSVLAHCLSRRIQTSWTTHWPRLIVLLIFADSWLFLFSSGVVIFGIGLETTTRACTGAIAVCIIFYASSKVLIYLFLSEKVFVIWSMSSTGGRFRSPVYLVCLGTMVGYVVVLILMVLGEYIPTNEILTPSETPVLPTGAIHFWREDGACVIGLKAFSSIPLLVYDFYLTVFLNGLFIWPICRSGNPMIRRVAIRTLAASLAALLTSAVNIGVLTAQHGHQLGWVCLGSCGTDVIINAIAIFWVTSPTRSEDEPSIDRHDQSLIPKPNGEQENIHSPIEFRRQSPRVGMNKTMQPQAEAQHGSTLNSHSGCA
ncbi:hypothetical protein AAF712_014280 [Marasmius tenuissimus]|uniref:Transmembrane protein n=1 Tax=Marasmius tenuissimus TaxID=585030 RepID=A0ABR2ZDM6_9AGAR